VLTYVASNNADIGIVYESDAKQTDEVITLATVDEVSGEKIVYEATVVSETDKAKEAGMFIEYLLAKEAEELFLLFGFSHLHIADE